MRTCKKLEVYYRDTMVGMLALTNSGKVAFEYTDTWIEDGFAISPFSLPLKKQVYIPAKDVFHGLYGVFADSLPDAWGNVLLNRMLREKGIDTNAISVLDRLSIVGQSGMGALTYRPEVIFGKEHGELNLDSLAVACKRVLTSEESDNLDELYRLGGTSGGARPKVLMKIKDENWIVKFPAHVDRPDSGKMEYDYSVCAKKCGIQMTETKLFGSDICTGYFGTKRFDRRGDERLHMLSAAALLELDFEQPSMDYHDLMKLTKILTRDNPRDLDNMYRRMCFNVFAHNRDDHSKNFTFLYEEGLNRWCLSPAYDMTYSETYYGEHTTSVDGNGRDPGKSELLAVGIKAGMKRNSCEQIISEIGGCVHHMLSEYL